MSNTHLFHVDSPKYLRLRADLPTLLDRLAAPKGPHVRADAGELERLVPRESDLSVEAITAYYKRQRIGVTNAMVEYAADELAIDTPDGRRRIGNIELATRRSQVHPGGPCYMAFTR